MDTKLQQGDHVPGPWGSPDAVSGLQELVQRCMVRLTVRRGSFAPDPTLGSRLHTLPRGGGQELAALAQEYIAEALEGVPYTGLSGVRCTYDPEQDRVAVAFTLDFHGQRQELEVGV